MGIVSEAQKQQFIDEGYFILESVIPEAHLELLRSQCQRFIDQKDARMAEAGTDTQGINHKGKRYFIANCFRQEPKLREFLFSDLMAEVCQATLGDNAYLFWEQYVVKGAEMGMKFSWHQDSGYVGYPDHKPYLTCWCPLDDVSEKNGTVYLLPYSRSGIRSWVQHIVDEETNDKVGYFGDDRGIAVEVPAGSIVAFSSIVFHSSGTNTSDDMRRVYLAQYSCEPILTVEGDKLSGSAEPILKNGQLAVGKPGPNMPSRLDA